MSTSPRTVRYARIILYAAYSIGVLYVISETVFPRAVFVFNADTPRAQSNTLVIHQTNPLTFSAATIGTFDTATVTLTVRSNAPKPEPPTVRRGYRGILTLPIASMAAPPSPSNTSSLSSGSLFAYRDGVWIVDDTMVRPIVSARTLLAKGWSFEAVRTDVAAADIAQFERGPLFTLRDQHPHGTYVAAHDSPDTIVYYKLDKKALVPLTDKPPVPAVEITSASRNTLAPCTARPSFSATTYRYRCSLHSLRSLIGTDYLFTFSFPHDQFHHARITLHRAKTFSAFRERLSRFRTQITERLPH